MKKIFLVICLLIVLTGCAVNYKPEQFINPVDEKINKITLTGKATPIIEKDSNGISQTVGYNINVTGSGEIDHIKCKVTSSSKEEEFNPFEWKWIKETIKRFGRIIWAWFWAIFFIVISICSMTYIVRNNIKKSISLSPIIILLKGMSSRVWTLIFGALSYVIFALIKNPDWECNIALQVFCVIVANIGWITFVEFVGKKIVVPVAKKFAKKIILSDCSDNTTAL